MGRRKSNTASAAPAKRPAPAPPPARRSRRFWVLLAGAALLLALAGWGAWALWWPDPLRDARAALDRRDFRAADELLAKRLADDPNDRAARLLAARSARRARDFARAHDHLREYAQRHPADAAHALELALTRAQGGDQAEADRLFAEYSAKPDAPDTPFVMEAYLDGVLGVLAPGPNSVLDPETGDPAVVDRLTTAADLWLRTRPGRADQVQGLVWRGRIFRYARDHAKSVAAFREALALDPDSFDARYLLALGLGQEAPAEVVHHLEVLRTSHPENRYVRYGLATAYRMVGRPREARQLLEGLLAGPTEVSALVELGLLDLDEGNVAAAEPRLRRALELAPGAPETNVAMSRCMQLAGKPDEAAKFRKRFDEITAERNRPPAPAAPKKP